jgi:hypothetical protein
MIVKLNNNINIDDFIVMSFGADRNEVLPYYEYFCTDNLKLPTTARLENDILYVNVIQADGEIVELPYYSNESESMWDIYN